MNIYRPIGGVYRCINNPYEKQAYILTEKEGCYPALAPISEQEAAADSVRGKGSQRQALPIPDFSESDSKVQPHQKDVIQ